MKNSHRLALGLTVGAMAIGFSAFTSGNDGIITTKLPNGKVITTAYYYNKSGAPGSQAPANFVFRGTGTLAACTNSTSLECKAQWSTTNAPTNGQSPTDAGSPSYVGNTNSGDYNDQ